MPTREARIKDPLQDKPTNLVIRFSAPMVNQAAPASWPPSSEVVDKDFNCPAAQQDNECKDCRMCWDPKIKTIRYLFEAILGLNFLNITKILGLKLSTKLLSYIFSIIGPKLNVSKQARENLHLAFPIIKKSVINSIILKMW